MWKCTYIETSAKNNYNIEAVFQEILQLEQKRQLFPPGGGGEGEEEEEELQSGVKSDAFWRKHASNA